MIRLILRNAYVVSLHSISVLYVEVCAVLFLVTYVVVEHVSRVVLLWTNVTFLASVNPFFKLAPIQLNQMGRFAMMEMCALTLTGVKVEFV
jgi:hypothetical protein